VNGLKDGDAISRLAGAYGIHPLTVEDILDTEQRPKTEEFDAYILVILKDINRQDRDELDFDQISLVLLKDTVITFQELPVRSFEFIRRRLFSNAGRIRRMGAGYLAYMVLDTTVDDYAQTLDRLGDQIEDFENRAAQETGDDFIDESQRLKRELLQLRRAVWPLRENLSLMRYESPLLSADLSPFFTDLHDHVVQAAETIDAYREVIAGVMEVNLSALSNRTNRVMKVLTIISTLFIPLTFIVGVYGMNFRTMPELEYRYAYPITWVVMILIAGIMLLVFKRRKWF
jgi:magnesium transporter